MEGWDLPLSCRAVTDKEGQQEPSATCSYRTHLVSGCAYFRAHTALLSCSSLEDSNPWSEFRLSEVSIVVWGLRCGLIEHCRDINPLYIQFFLKHPKWQKFIPTLSLFSSEPAREMLTTQNGETPLLPTEMNWGPCRVLANSVPGQQASLWGQAPHHTHHTYLNCQCLWIKSPWDGQGKSLLCVYLCVHVKGIDCMGKRIDSLTVQRALVGV